MSLIAQLKIPGSSAMIQVPSNVPEAIRPNPSADVFESSGAALISFGFNWIFILGIMAAFVMFMWGGVEWISSRGDAAKLAAAKKRILYSIIGVVVIMLAYVIVRTVITVLGRDAGFFRI